MFNKKETGLTRATVARDPFAMLRRMTSELDRMFDEPGWPSVRWPSLAPRELTEASAWLPGIDVFEKDNQFVTRIDLPGMKKEDIKVEVTDGHLTISGERKREVDDKKEGFYRCEREYGRFYRSIPLPDGVTFENVKATFADGVLEISVPLPARPVAKVRTVEIQAPATAAKPAA